MFNLTCMLLGILFLTTSYFLLPMVVIETIFGLSFGICGIYLSFVGLVYRDKVKK